MPTLFYPVRGIRKKEQGPKGKNCFFVLYQYGKGNEFSIISVEDTIEKLADDFVFQTQLSPDKVANDWQLGRVMLLYTPPIDFYARTYHHEGCPEERRGAYDIRRLTSKQRGEFESRLIAEIFEEQE